MNKQGRKFSQEERKWGGQIRAAQPSYIPYGRNALTHRKKKAVGLTPREREVALLYAQGYTYQEIANHLALSIRTVNNHMYHIFNKVGDSRSKVVAYVTKEML